MKRICIYGFAHGDYPYFVTVQTEDDMPHCPNVPTSLARVCIRNPTFPSYTELPIFCKDGSDNEYVYATTALLGKAGSKQSRKFDATESISDVLFVAFSYSEYVFISKKLCICAFTMDKIQAHFETVVRRCFNASAGSLILNAFNTEQKQCTISTFSKKDLCSSDINRYIEGTIPFLGTFVSYVAYDRITSFAIIAQGDETIVVLGRFKGWLNKRIMGSPLALFTNALLYLMLGLEKYFPTLRCLKTVAIYILQSERKWSSSQLALVLFTEM